MSDFITATDAICHGLVQGYLDIGSMPPTLHMILPKNHPTQSVYQIDVLYGPEALAWNARRRVFNWDPLYAVVGFEATTFAAHVPSTDPDYRRVLLGEVAIHDIPPEKLLPLLVAHCEDRSGNWHVRLWQLSQHGKRTCVPYTALAMDTPTSRFYPLFVADDLLRKLTEQTLPEEKKDFDQISYAERRAVCRDLTATILATPHLDVHWETTRQQVIEDERQRILHTPAT